MSAYEFGHMAPSSRLALSLKPSVWYLTLYFPAVHLGPPRRSRSWVRQTIGSHSPRPWRSQLCQAFTEPGGYTRSQEDTKKIQFRVPEESRGHHRTREATALRRFGTVRPRVQIPGPRPISEFKISDFGHRRKTGRADRPSITTQWTDQRVLPRCLIPPEPSGLGSARSKSALFAKASGHCVIVRRDRISSHLTPRVKNPGPRTRFPTHRESISFMR